MKFLLLYRRRWGYLYLPVILVALLGILWCAMVWRPLPPIKLSVAGSVSQGGYATMAQRYRDVLDRHGIEVEVVKSNNITETVAQLADNSNDIDMGFLLGLVSVKAPPNLKALAVIERNPVWIFTRLPEINHTSQLKGLRITAASTSVRNPQTSFQLLAHAKIKPEDVTFEFKSVADAAKDLIDAKTDVVVLLASSRSDIVRSLTRAAGIHMVGIDRVLALTSRDPLISPIVLPQGAIELRGDIPPKDLTMVSYALHLVINDKRFTNPLPFCSIKVNSPPLQTLILCSQLWPNRMLWVSGLGWNNCCHIIGLNWQSCCCMRCCLYSRWRSCC
jgi:TRAP-type uncharacterized transport system substrate-binding protein